jgi:hypothetical protein
MSAERIPAETATPPDAGPPADEVPLSAKLQILTAEQSSLAATRSLAWNEAFSRAGMYLSTLSGAMVALALVAQGSGPGRVAQQFGLVILPIVLFVGIATFIRLGAANTNEAMCVIGMNRIRAGYLEVAPEMAKYFVMSAHDDTRGVGVTMGVDSGRPSFAHFIAATPIVVATLNSVVVGVIFVLVGLQLGAEIGPSVVAGLVGFALAAALQGRYASVSIARGRAGVRPVFPHPAEGLPLTRPPSA